MGQVNRLRLGQDYLNPGAPAAAIARDLYGCLSPVASHKNEARKRAGVLLDHHDAVFARQSPRSSLLTSPPTPPPKIRCFPDIDFNSNLNEALTDKQIIGNLSRRRDKPKCISDNRSTLSIKKGGSSGSIG
jgi:hypothetical protein